MGTSGSYGGSTKHSWKDARQQVLNLPADSVSDGNGNDQTPDDRPLEVLWATIAVALDSDDPTLHTPSVGEPQISLSSLMPWLRRSGGGGSGGSGAGVGGAPVRTGGGRQGSASRRQVVRSAARGGTALGAAYAVRRGDAVYLTELGLDLAHLQGLSPTRQCAEILDAVLGEGSHPDELALRRASLQALKEVLVQTEVPDQGSTVRSFVVNYVFELSLVELQKQINDGAVSAEDAGRKERAVRSYLDKRVRSISLPTDGVIQSRDLRAQASRLTQETIKLLRAGQG